MAGFNFSPRALRYIERRMRELAVPPATPAPLTPRVTAHSLIHDIDLDTYALELRFSQVGDTHGSLTIPRSLIASPHNVVLQRKHPPWTTGTLIEIGGTLQAALATA